MWSDIQIARLYWPVTSIFCVFLLLQCIPLNSVTSLSNLLWTTNERVNNDLGTTQQDRPDIALNGAGKAYSVWRDQ